MTREEAIKNLEMIRVAFVEPVTKEQKKIIDDSFDMAIKALEQMPCEDATNGEVFLKMFPPSVYYCKGERLVLLAKGVGLKCANDNWWNAPYKADKGDKE